MTNLSQEDWKSRIDNDNNAVIIDVRTEEEVAVGKIPNAIHLDIYKGQGFIYEVDTLDKNKHYFVYCRVGARSANACKIMDQLGFLNTFNLLGGIELWQGNLD